MLSLERFKVIKKLKDGGLDETEIQAFVPSLEKSTIRQVIQSATYEAYKSRAAKERSNSRWGNKAKSEKDECKGVIQQSVTVQATHYMECELRRHTELLQQISNKLAFIVEELAGPVKKEEEK